MTSLTRAKELTAQAIRSLDDLEGVGDPDVAGTVGEVRRNLCESLNLALGAESSQEY